MCPGRGAEGNCGKHECSDLFPKVSTETLRENNRKFFHERNGLLAYSQSLNEWFTPSKVFVGLKDDVNTDKLDFFKK